MGVKTNHWWKITVVIPEYFKQYERVQCKQYHHRSIPLFLKKKTLVEFDPGCEAMIYSVDGVPLQGKCSRHT